MRSVLTAVTILCAAGGSIAITPARTAAQQRLAREDAVPRDFLVALMGMFPELAKSDFVGGALSPEVAAKIELPPRARVLGTFVSSVFTVAIAETGTAPDSVATQVRRSMTARGWRLNEESPSGGGFSQPTTAIGTTWCNGENMVGVVVEPRPNMKGSLVRYVFSEARTRGCRPPAETVDGSERSPLPTLYDPDDAERDFETCRDDMTNEATGSSRTTYRSSLSIDAILAHYSKQLADSGWSSTLPGQSNSIVVATWTKRDNLPRDRRLTLTISTLTGKPGCRFLELGVKSFEKR